MDDLNILGYKGAMLCELKLIKVPVPEGFIISCDACTDYLVGFGCFEQPGSAVLAPQLSPHLCSEISQHIHQLEKVTGSFFGIANVGQNVALPTINTPLLISIRVSTNIAVEGVVDTVLNVGLNDAIVCALAATSMSSKFAYDTYRRFLQSYGINVNGIDSAKFIDVLERVLSQNDLQDESQLTTADLQLIVQEFKLLANVPEDPLQQVKHIIQAMYCSWKSPIATQYRRLHSISDGSGVAVIIQSMVYGNKDDGCSGSGVLCTRNPSSGQKEITGEFLSCSEGDDVLHGSSLWDCTSSADSDSYNVTTYHKLAMASRRGRVISSLEDGLKFNAKLTEAYYNLIFYANKIESHFRDMQEIEFTVQNGTVYILECGTAKRSAKASLKVSVDMVAEDLLNEREALLRIDPENIEFFERNCVLDPIQVCESTIKRGQSAEMVAKGLSVSVGAITGKLAFTKETADSFAAQGYSVVFCTNRPWESIGIRESDGLLLLNGTMHSLGSRMARSLGKCGVALVGECSPSQFSIHRDANELYLSNGGILVAGDELTLDGFTGNIYAGTMDMASGCTDPDYHRIMEWANMYKQLNVLAQTGSYKDAQKAAEHGADGIGLCCTDYMISSKECKLWASAALISQDLSHIMEFLNKAQPFHEEEVLKVIALMPQKQVSFRLLNSPLNFLPILPHSIINNGSDAPDMSTTFAARNQHCSSSNIAFSTSQSYDEFQDLSHLLSMDLQSVYTSVRDMRETSFLGFCGSRWCVVYPEVVAMQTRAIIGAAITATKSGHTLGKIEILFPLVVSDNEIECIAPILKDAAEMVMHERGMKLEYHIGVSLEGPRCCIKADSIVKECAIDFVTFDTNRLTQLIYGFSEVDTGRFLNTYMNKHILATNPFKSIDRRGVGAMMELGINKIRDASSVHNKKPKLKIGICGEQGADPYSVAYYNGLKVNNISVPPTKISVAKISAAQAYIKENPTH